MKVNSAFRMVVLAKLRLWARLKSLIRKPTTPWCLTA